MKKYDVNNEEELVDSIISTLEKETDKKIFTMRVLERKKEELDLVVVYEDKSVLSALVNVEMVDGKVGVRMRGKYI